MKKSKSKKEEITGFLTEHKICSPDEAKILSDHNNEFVGFGRKLVKIQMLNNKSGPPKVQLSYGEWPFFAPSEVQSIIKGKFPEMEALLK
jgi:hypothetical protein